MAGRCDGVTHGVTPTGGQLHSGSTCHGGFGKVYELEDLQNITNNFSEERLLGEGGFGKVYKGLLPNGDIIAVKKLTSTMPGIKDRQFDNEAWHLMRLSHPNIVQLVGYCSHTEEILVLHQGKYVYAEKSERLLCLEYQPKGSLHEHLSDESSGLDWDSRYKIIEGICNGLHYLHEKWQASTPIIHMDLKPKNILLDDNMVPKIADFGLSRLFGEEQTRTCTASRDGTLGYMAPEYLNRGIITKKLDIFSLGVIIIEIVTGHKDYPDETDTSSQEFIELVLKNWRNRLEKTPGYTTAFSIFPSFCREIDYQRIRRCIQIGLACVKLNRAKRPTTLEVLNMLHKSEGAECSNGKEDYTNERPEEVNGPLYNKAEDRLNGTQNFGSSKGKKRERDERGIDPAKLHRDSLHNIYDSEPGSFKLDDMESKIAKIKKGGLANVEAVEELLHLMKLDQTEQRIDLSGRVILADVIAATEKPDILHVFMESKGLLVLDSWLQEAHKGKSGDGSSKEADKPIDDLLLALLRALAKLPINLSALQSCSIGKSVNHLRSHKNLEIQKKAKCLVENWKKRVDAEMKSNDSKPLTGQSASWPGKAGFQEISNTGSKRGGSSEHSPKNAASTVSSLKVLTDKPGGTDAVAKLNHVAYVSSKGQHIQPGNVAANLKDQPCRSTGGSELPTVKEEKSSNSSQSLNNSHSCSSEPSKDARSSTAASGGASKTSGSSSRGHQKATNGLVSGNLKETSVGRCVSLDRSLLPDKSSPTGSASEKGVDMPSDHGNNHRLIVRFPNPGRSPARSASGGSFEDTSVTGGRALSPVVAERHEQSDRRVKMKTENSRPHLTSDVNAESWHSNEIKGTAGSEEGEKSPCAMLDDNSRTPDDSVKDAHASRVVCSASSYMNEKGICSSETKVGNSFSPMNALIEIKYSEANHSLHAGDDTAMDLLASVAGEISKSELVSPSSPRNSSAKKLGCEGDNAGKVKVESDVGPSQDPGPADAKKVVGGKEVKIDSCLAANEEQRQTVPSPELADSKAVGSSVKIEIHEGRAKKCYSQPDSVDSKGENRDACRQGKVEDGCTDKDGAVDSTLGSQCRLVVSSRNSRFVLAGESSLSAADKQAQGLLKSSTNHKKLLGVSGHSGAFNSRDSMAGKLDLMAAEVKKADVVGDSSILRNEEEKYENASFPSADVPKLVVAAASPESGINKAMKESKDTSSESNSHVKSEGVNSQQSEHSAKQSSKKSSDGVSGKDDGKDDLVSSDEGSSLAAHTMSNATAKLDFDLNEGIPGDDGHQSEPTISPAICSSTVHLTGLSPFTSPVTCGLQSAPITVAAPAKGPFVPPENLLRAKPEIGWKGSAATSAFRPAEPRKILDMPATTHDIPVSHTAGKQSRPMLGFDLNVAGDQALQEDIPESSAQTTCSESGNTKSRDGSSRSAGIELDLNRADEVADNGQFMSNASHTVELPLASTRSLPGMVSNAGMNILRDFDLNSGPDLDDAVTEPVPKNLPAKNSSSIQFLQVPGLRMNNVAMSNLSPWLAPANPCGPVAIQSFLPSRGEQLYQIEAASGAQRIIASTTDSGQFGGDPCRPPVISTSPAMVFHPPAYQYAGFPSFPPTVHLQAPAFSVGSATFANSASAVPYFQTLSPTLVGPAGSLPAQHSRQYAINLAEGSSSGRDSSRKWESQGLDLNSGPGSIDLEGKDARAPLPFRQNLITPPHGFAEDQGRIYQMPVVGTKRKEPDGSWDTERSTYKQLSWQ